MRRARTVGPFRPVRRQRGFTLIEMGVVIFIMAILLGSILVPLSNQVEQRQLLDTQRQLEEIREALIGHALAQSPPRLPCPDKTTTAGSGTANDGREDFDTATGLCSDLEGNVPWMTLGLAGTDVWGHRIRYRVSPQYAQRDPLNNTIITLNSVGVLRMCSNYTTAGVCDAITESAPASTINMPAAVLVSHGPNGWGSIDPVTNTQLVPPGCAAISGCAQLSANEIVNADASNVFFVSGPPSAANSAGGVFDDIVIWLSPHVLKQRLVAGGKLP